MPMDVITALSEFGRKVYIVYINCWDWLNKEIVIMDRGRWMESIMDFFDWIGASDRQFGIQNGGYNELSGRLWAMKYGSIVTTPIEVILWGISAIIVIKLVRLIWDALPWL